MNKEERKIYISPSQEHLRILIDGEYKGFTRDDIISKFQQPSLRWIKASERLPKDELEKYCRITVGEEMVCKDILYYENDLWYFANDDRLFTLPIKNLEWLSESGSPLSKKEDEQDELLADKLLTQYMKDEDEVTTFGDKKIIDWLLSKYNISLKQ